MADEIECSPTSCFKGMYACGIFWYSWAVLAMLVWLAVSYHNDQKYACLLVHATLNATKATSGAHIVAQGSLIESQLPKVSDC